MQFLGGLSGGEVEPRSTIGIAERSLMLVMAVRMIYEIIYRRVIFGQVDFGEMRVKQVARCDAT